MNEKSWDKFFEMVDDVVKNTPGATWQEKRDFILSELEGRTEQGSWDELIGWFVEE